MRGAFTTTSTPFFRFSRPTRPPRRRPPTPPAAAARTPPRPPRRRGGRLAQPAGDGLPQLRVVLGGEAGVLLVQLVEPHRELVLVPAVGGLERDGDVGIGELHPPQR